MTLSNENQNIFLKSRRIDDCVSEVLLN